MGRDHPVSWCRDIDYGRSWYTGIGNSAALFADAQVRMHLRGGMRPRSAAPTSSAAPRSGALPEGQLTREVGEPMDLAVLPDAAC